MAASVVVVVASSLSLSVGTSRRKKKKKESLAGWCACVCCVDVGRGETASLLLGGKKRGKRVKEGELLGQTPSHRLEDKLNECLNALI